MTDVLYAIITLLKSDSAVSSMVVERVFGEELPQSETSSMPRQCIVLRSAGGIEKRQTGTTSEKRIDVFCYGATVYQCSVLDRAVTDVIKALERSAISGVLLHSIGFSGGPFQMREPDTEWPVAMRSIIVTADERQIGG